MQPPPLPRREFLQRMGQAAASATAITTGLHTMRATAQPGDRPRFRFFLWNDLHVRAPHVTGRPPPYPFANEKAQWAVECAQGKHGFGRPDFAMAAGDIIDGETPDFDADFAYVGEHLIKPLGVPFLPCLGNHENGQGEGLPDQNLAWDRAFGRQRRDYAFTCGGIGFIVVDTSGAHRLPDEVTGARNAFVERAFEHLTGLPAILVTHVPLIAMREERALKASFGFPSWRVLDTRLLEIVEAHADRVIAVLAGHLHLTGVREQRGIHHIVPTGTAGYPADFASLEVFADHLRVRMHRAPEEWLPRSGDIHGKPRHAVDYTDPEHRDHESYIWGNPGERDLTIPLEGPKRPDPGTAPVVTFVDGLGRG